MEYISRNALYGVWERLNHWCVRGKANVFFGLMLLVVALTVLHTFFLSRGESSYVYAGLRDVAIILLSAGMCRHNLACLARNTEHSAAYVTRAGLFVIIGVIHFLRLLWGGLLC